MSHQTAKLKLALRELDERFIEKEPVASPSREVTKIKLGDSALEGFGLKLETETPPTGERHSITVPPSNNTGVEDTLFVYRDRFQVVEGEGSVPSVVIAPGHLVVNPRLLR